MGFSKPAGLRKRREFLRVQQGGRRVKGRLMVLLTLPGEEDRARIGYTVSRKVGNAVVRNHVRRRLREIARAHSDILCEKHDHVVIAFAPAADATFQALEQELTWLMQQAARRSRGSFNNSCSSS